MSPLWYGKATTSTILNGFKMSERKRVSKTDPGNVYLGQDYSSGNRPSNRHNGLPECISKFGPGTDDESRAAVKS